MIDLSHLPRKRKVKSITIGFRVPEDLRNWLLDFADKHNVSASALLVELLTAFKNETDVKG